MVDNSGRTGYHRTHTPYDSHYHLKNLIFSFKKGTHRR